MQATLPKLRSRAWRHLRITILQILISTRELRLSMTGKPLRRCAFNRLGRMLQVQPKLHPILISPTEPSIRQRTPLLATATGKKRAKASYRTTRPRKLGSLRRVTTTRKRRTAKSLSVPERATSEIKGRDERYILAFNSTKFLISNSLLINLNIYFG